MLDWLRNVFLSLIGHAPERNAATAPRRGATTDRRRTERRAPSVGRRSTDRAAAPAAPAAHTAPAAPARAAQATPDVDRDEEGEELPAMPEPTRGGGLDAVQTLEGQTLQARQKELLADIGRRIEEGKYQMPHLSSTSMVVINLAANPGSEITEIVDSISTDPVLSSRLLQLANSVLYAAQEPAETLHEAVMRVGMRELRSLIFALSMRQVIQSKSNLKSYADEIWRQSYSVGVICRAIGPMCGMAKDKAFLLGLLHDVGKIPLIAMLQDHKNPSDITPAVVGRAFLDFHEKAGAAMARRWKLSEEFVSVAGCHHHYEENEEHSRSAALVTLAHRLDMHLSMGNSLYWSKDEHHELQYLGIPSARHHEILKVAHEAFLQNAEPEAQAA